MTIHKNFHRNLRRIFVAGLVGMALTQSAVAATVRGRLERRQPNGAVAPAAGITVTVFSQAAGRSRQVQTGPDGMYYIYNVRPGDNTLEIWTSRDPHAPPSARPIRVNEPTTDLAPIVVQ